MAKAEPRNEAETVGHTIEHHQKDRDSKSDIAIIATTQGVIPTPRRILPPEIFFRVLYFLLHSRGWPLVHQIAPAIQVCRYWRDVAMSSPTLWTSIRVEDSFATPIHVEHAPLSKLKFTLGLPTYSPEVVLEMLRRSDEAPLDVILHLKDEVGTETFDALIRQTLQEMSRIRTLRIHTSEHYWSVCLPFLQLPAPRLRLLHVVLPTGSHRMMPAYLIDPGIRTSLRDLRVVQISTVWSALDIRKLTHFDINALGQAAPTFNEFLAMLRTCQRLVALTYYGYLQVKESDLFAGEQPVVHLNHLRKLSLGAGIKDGTKLLESLQMPILDTWSISFFSNISYSYPMSIPPNLPSAAPKCCKFTVYMLRNRLVIHSRPDDRHFDGTGQVNYHFPLSREPHQPFALLNHLLTSVDFSTTRDLEIMVYKLVEQVEPLWTALFGLLHNVQSLMVGPPPQPGITPARVSEDFLDALLTPRSDGSSLLPRLSQLVVSIHIVQDVPADREVFLERLAAWAETRKRHGMPIQRLGILNLPSLEPALVETIQRAVEQFRWTPTHEDDGGEIDWDSEMTVERL